MTMHNGSPGRRSRDQSPILRHALAGLLGVAGVLLVACGSSGAGLIPTGNAGPLQGDFEAVAQAAQNGNGNCAATEAQILKTEHDFSELPSTVDVGLRDTLRQGITSLRSRALALCAQPHPQATATGTSPKTRTSTTPTTPTVTQTTSTQTTPTTTTPTTSSPGGGTPAPGAGGEEVPPGEGGGTRPGEGAPSGGDGSGGAGGIPGQERGK
jgi:hypothetical protein